MMSEQRLQPLTGYHHMTMVTRHAPTNARFYRDTLRLRLVKKTVNQDDVPLVDTTRTVVGGTIEEREIEELPNNTRNPIFSWRPKGRPQVLVVKVGVHTKKKSSLDAFKFDTRH